MLGAIASAALIVAASLTVGQAALTLCGRRDDRAVAGPVGLALLLVAAGLTAAAGGRGVAIAIALGLLTLVGAGVLVRSGLPQVARDERIAAISASLGAGVFAALPFFAAGAVGILGVGLVNDDMASHLLLADWLDERFRPEPVLIDQGYPIGPHALVAGLGTLLGARTVDVFAGLILALPAIAAFAICAYLRDLRALPRIAVSIVAAVPYLAAAYLAQEAFKEPMLALFVLAFALLLPASGSPRRAVALGLLAAGTVYVYSFPGLAWLAGAALVWGTIEAIRGRRPGRTTLLGAAAAAAALVVTVAPDIGRVLDFGDFRALDPDRANEGGLGNLPGHISPLEALGIWPTSEFRLSLSASSVPAIVFYACGMFGLLAFALGLPRWLRRHGTAIPAALLTALVLYLAARAFGTVYTSAKALAIAAPLLTLITLGGLLAAQRGPPATESSSKPRSTRLARALPALAAVFAIAAAASSFLILRQAPVAPEAHAKELAEIRPLVQGEKLLFLGRDNFVLWELRGSKPFTAVRNFYDPYYVQPNLELEQVFSKFDFDSVTGEDLNRFRYVLTTRAAYGSSPPPGYEAVKETDTFVLWERGAEGVGQRRPGEHDAAPGAVRECTAQPGPTAGRAAVFGREPIVVSAAEWSGTTVESGEVKTVALAVPEGRWAVSLQYDSTRPLTLAEPRDSSSAGTGFAHTLPANLDYRGSTPFYPAGTIEGGREYVLGASVESPPFLGELLGAHSVAHLGALALTRVTGSGPSAASRPYPGDSARVLPLANGCGRYVDWYEREGDAARLSP
jgi:hypothetical protein